LRLFNIHEQKICFFCSSKITVKYGNARGKERYKCSSCGKQFLGGDRLITDVIWEEYTKGKQTYKQLALKYNRSIKTIQRRIDQVRITRHDHFERVVNVLMDTTYFGRSFGVMVFKDSISGQFLYKQYVKHETNLLYLAGIEEIARRGITIQAIICDGRKGLLQLFGDIPVQMCQFHQIQIVTRYLTKKPKSACAAELRLLALQLTYLSKASFSRLLEQWYEKWEPYVNERTIALSHSAKRKSYYTHKRLRSAYLSLKRNTPWLFICEEYRELMIPNTTNAIDGSFADLKNKLRNHNGLSLKRKQKVIDEFFKV
jgi:DNA-directed RNA polymerase subunit RPC12/RpoP